MKTLRSHFDSCQNSFLVYLLHLRFGDCLSFHFFYVHVHKLHAHKLEDLLQVVIRGFVFRSTHGEITIMDNKGTAGFKSTKSRRWLLVWRGSAGLGAARAIGKLLCSYKLAVFYVVRQFWPKCFQMKNLLL